MNGPRQRFLDGEWAGAPIFQDNRDKVYVADISHPEFSFNVGLRIASAVPEPGVPCPWDINGDGEMGVMDLIDLLDCFAQPAIPGCESEDVNDDGTVNVLDLIDLLLAFGTACP